MGRGRSGNAGVALIYWPLVGRIGRIPADPPGETCDTMNLPKPFALLPLGLCWILASADPGSGATIAGSPGPSRADPVAAGEDAGSLYQRLCAVCHGPDRLGITGPALIPEGFGRLKPAEALAVILNGRPASQMLGFSDRVSEAQAQSLVDLIYQPLPETPAWGLDRIAASRLVLVQETDLPERPRHDADPLNLFVVVETGDHHATILDGDRLEPIHRFATRRALHGGPKFSPDGRFVYFASRDGWVSKFDLYGLQTVAEVRAGINTRNLAVSGDGRYVAVANYLPHTLLILDAKDLTPLRLIPVRDDTGKGSRVSAVYAAPPRQSFVAALKDIPEVWEILVADDPPPVYNGPMHDYRMEEGTARELGTLPGSADPPRRLPGRLLLRPVLSTPHRRRAQRQRTVRSSTSTCVRRSLSWSSMACRI